MSNYTKTTDFAVKDGLSSGNPAKLITGTGIDTEFNNIQTAIGTKADDSSVVHVSGTESITGAKTFTSTVTVTDGNFQVVGSSDGTKKVSLEVDGLTPATTRTLTVQDVNGTLYVSGGTDIPVADGGTGASTASDARTNLGLVIGTDVAPVASPAFTGNPTAPTPSAADNDTSIATTAYVQTELGGTRNPSFSVTRGGSNQISITASDYTKIQFTTEDFDTNNNFDNATNYRFTPTVAGKYLITLTCAVTSINDGKSVYAAIFRNGSIYLQSSDFVGGTTQPGPTVVALVSMNGSTDYIEGFIFNGDSVTQTLDGTVYATRMAGIRISS